MNMRLKKVLDDIQKTENKILELQEHVRQLRIQKKQMEDAEIIKAIRSMKMDSRKMLKEGRLIAVRTHTRFVYFPAHRHNFVEVLYVCEGSLTNIIDGKKVIVNKGELLFLNQFTKHEILKAGQNDIAINFMVLPEFFDVAYTMAGNNNVLADFLNRCHVCKTPFQIVLSRNSSAPGP